MALSVQGSASNTTFSGTTVTVTLPTHASGDLHLLFSCGQSAVSAFASGYTQFADSPAASSFAYSSAGKKVDTGSESNPVVTWGSSGNETVCLIVIAGASSTLIYAAPVIDSGFGTTVTPTALNAAGATVYSVLGMATDGQSGAITWPSGWTAQEVNPGDPFGPGCAIAINTSPGSGTITPGSISMASGRNKVVWHVLVQAAGGGGGRTAKNTRAWELGMERGVNLWGEL